MRKRTCSKHLHANSEPLDALVAHHQRGVVGRHGGAERERRDCLNQARRDRWKEKMKTPAGGSGFSLNSLPSASRPGSVVSGLSFPVKPVSHPVTPAVLCSANMAHAVSPGYVFPKTAAPTTQYTFGKQLGQPGQVLFCSCLFSFLRHCHGSDTRLTPSR
jgi:hypothetical protein